MKKIKTKDIMEQTPTHIIKVNLGEDTLGSFEENISDVDLVVGAAEAIEDHMKAQDSAFWTIFVQTIDGKKVSEEVRNKAISKCWRRTRQRKKLFFSTFSNQ